MIGLGSRLRTGVTLIEVMVSIVLVATILLASITASANLLRRNQDLRDNNQGLALAHQFVDEITAMDFRDPTDPIFGLESGEDANDRTTLDDVDDYHNYSQSPPTHRNGAAIAGMENWTVSVSIIPADPDATGVVTAGSNQDSPLRVVSVTCTLPSGETVNSATLVSEVPVNISADSSYESWRRVRLDFPDRAIEITAPLRNKPDPIY